MNINIRKVLSLLLVGVFTFSSFTPMAGKAYGEPLVDDDHVIEISEAEELLELMSSSVSLGEDFSGKILRLMDDIDLGGVYGETIDAMELETVTFNTDEDSPFRGTFDGNGYTITGLKHDISGDDGSCRAETGLFGYTDGAVIKDLTIKDAVIDSDYLGGILVSYAKNTEFRDISIIDSTLTMYCYNVVLTLGSDGGLTGGALAGQAMNCYLYNCEAIDTVVRANMTSGVEAASGKGMYMGGLVGDLKGGTMEYCRVHGDESLVKLHYDVAVGALGGITGYVGGLVGELQNGGKIIDCFSTAELDCYTATYVSVGAGNSGKVGGIAAAVYGNTTEIHRCHYAGIAKSKQYNAVLVIPIIQKNKNISGIVENYQGDVYNVWNTYYKYQLNSEVKMGTLGNETTTSQFGPKDDETYGDRSFWESRGYDFTKWVMDYSLGIPVHGSSIKATFDFPGSGEVIIGPTELVSSSVSTDNPLKTAVQGFDAKHKKTNLSMNLKDGYMVDKWYKVKNMEGTSFSSIEDIVRLEENGVVIERLDLKDQGMEANDIFIADVKAKVTFYMLDGITEEVVESGDNWYDYGDTLPQVIPSNQPAGSTFLGWTTDRSYENITNAQLKKIDLYNTGDKVKESLNLYPVFAQLKTNVKVVIEGHGISEDSRMDEDTLVGNVRVGQDLDGRIYVELTDFVGEDYRFLGWYEGCDKDAPRYTGGGKASKDAKFYLDQYDLSSYSVEEPLVLVCKMEYLVTYYSTTTKADELDSNNPFLGPVAYRWHRYGEYFDDLEGALPLDLQDSLISWHLGEAMGADHDCDNEEVTSEDVVNRPISVHGHTDGKVNVDMYLSTDFPGASTVSGTQSGTAGLYKVKLNAHPRDGYNYIFWAVERMDGKKTFVSKDNPFSIDNNFSSGSNFYGIAHMDADVNFYFKSGGKATVTRCYEELIFSEKTMISKYVYPYSSDKVIEGYFHESMASPDEGEFYEDNYYYIGGISEYGIEVDGSDWDYLYDVEGERFCTSDVGRAMPYLMDGSEVCTETVNIYPVYCKYEIETEARLPVDVPYYCTASNVGDGEPMSPGSKNIIRQSDSGADESGKGNIYVVCDNSEKLESVTVYADGEELETIETTEFTTDDGFTEGEEGITYTVEPGVKYKFVANYESLGIKYHIGPENVKTVVRNFGDLAGEQPLPETVLENTVFAGWTLDRPEEGWFSSGEDFNPVTENTAVYSFMELWPVFLQVNISAESNIDRESKDHRGLAWKIDEDCQARCEFTALNEVAIGDKIYGFRYWCTDYGTENETVVSLDTDFSLYNLQILSEKTYTAVYEESYVIRYFDLDGSLIYTDHISSSETEPLKNMINYEVFDIATDRLSDGYIFDQWKWFEDGSYVSWEDFCEKTAAGNMDLYLSAWLMYGLDSEGSKVDSVEIRADLNKKSLYATFSEDYLQPNITIQVEKVQSVSGNSEMAVTRIEDEFKVSLHPLINDVAQLYETKTTDGGKAIFNLDVILTINKSGGKDGESFLIDIKGEGSLTIQTVVVDKNSPVSVRLPQGVYTVEENSLWAWNYEDLSKEVSLYINDGIEQKISLENCDSGSGWFGNYYRASNIYEEDAGQEV